MRPKEAVVKILKALKRSPFSTKSGNFSDFVGTHDAEKLRNDLIRGRGFLLSQGRGF